MYIFLEPNIYDFTFFKVFHDGTFLFKPIEHLVWERIISTGKFESIFKFSIG